MPGFPFEPPRVPMEARVRDELPDGGDWAYEPKWDGFRVLAWSPPQARLDSRNGRPLLRYFPELEPALATLPAATVVDAEVVVVVDGRLDFDQLSQRIHPAASRIALLARDTPAQLVAFDLLADRGEDVRGQPFARRRQRLEALLADLPDPWHLTPSTRDRGVGLRWLDEFEAAGCDGIVAKRGDGGYVEGRREMVKVKHRRSADCVAAGYRLHKDGPGSGIGSLLLGLYDDAGQMGFVGHCSNFSAAQRVELLARLSTLALPGDDDGFGRDGRRPGAPSRWTGAKDLAWVAIEPTLVCEVSYQQMTGGRFRHATRFERWRPDKEPAQCTRDQLERPDGADFDDVVVT